MVIIIGILIFIINYFGLSLGLIIMSIIDVDKNKILIIVISECLLSINSGIFIKISLVDMIDNQLKKYDVDDDNKNIRIKIIMIIIGIIIGISLSLLIKFLQN